MLGIAPGNANVAMDAAQKALWLYELHLNGFVIFAGFLPNDLIEAMHEQFQPIYRGEWARLQAGDTSSLRGRNRMSFDIRVYVEKLKGPLDDDRFRRNPIIEDLVEAVLGRWRYGVTKAECPFKDADTMAWHPDVPNDRPRDRHEPVRPTRLTFNVPLVDVTDSNGGRWRSFQALTACTTSVCRTTFTGCRASTP